MTMPRLEVPDHLNRNSPRIRSIGSEETGSVLLRVACEVLGLDDLSSCDVLDVGCGVRFVQTIINRNIPIRSYAGIDVDDPVISFLKNEVRDPRFTFARWDVHNPLYNIRGPRMTRDTLLPVEGDFDVIWLFSVFTHLAPEDADAMLAILRRHVRREGRLLFSALLDPSVGTFEEKAPQKAGLRSTYNEAFMRSLVERNGWAVLALHDKDPMTKFIQHHFLCAPV